MFYNCQIRVSRVSSLSIITAHCPCFTDKEVEVQRLNGLPVDTRLLRARLDWSIGLLGLNPTSVLLSAHCALGGNGNGSAPVT